MVLETPTEKVWPKEVEILQRMADTSIPESDLDFDAMAEEIRVEAKKHEKEPVKKEKKAVVSKKGKTAVKGKERRMKATVTTIMIMKTTKDITTALYSIAS
jgi:hypothetical protein